MTRKASTSSSSKRVIRNTRSSRRSIAFTASVSVRLPVEVAELLRKSVPNVSGFVRKVVIESLERLPVWFETEEFRLEVEAAQLIRELQILHRYQKAVLKHGSYAEAYLKKLKGGLVQDRRPFHVAEPPPDIKPEEKQLVGEIVGLRERLAGQLTQKLNRLVELKKSHVNSQKGGDKQK